MRSQEMCRLVGAFVGSKADAGCSLADGAAWLPLVPSETVVCLSIATLAPGLWEDCRCDGRTKASRLSVCKQAGQAEVVARQGQPQPFIAMQICCVAIWLWCKWWTSPAWFTQLVQWQISRWPYRSVGRAHSEAIKMAIAV